MPADELAPIATDTMRQLADSEAELARREDETEQSLAEVMSRRGAPARTMTASSTGI